MGLSNIIIDAFIAVPLPAKRLSWISAPFCHLARLCSDEIRHFRFSGMFYFQLCQEPAKGACSRPDQRAHQDQDIWVDALIVYITMCV